MLTQQKSGGQTSKWKTFSYFARPIAISYQISSLPAKGYSLPSKVSKTLKLRVHQTRERVGEHMRQWDSGKGGHVRIDKIIK